MSLDVKEVTNNGSGDGSNPEHDPDANTNDKANATLTYEIWYSEQDDTIKGLLDGRLRVLKSALDTERENRKGFEKQIKELAGKSEKGSEAEQQLTALSEQIAATDRKAAFYEAAHAAGIVNLKLAFIVASTDNLFDKKGNVDFLMMKTNYPELFAKPVPNGNAGEGAGGPQGTLDMNAAIRRLAGKS